MGEALTTYQSLCWWWEWGWGERLLYAWFQLVLCCCSSVAKLYPTLCDNMDWSTPGFSPLTLGACLNSCPLSEWCYLTISSPAAPFSFCLQSFPASGSFPMSQLFASDGPSIGVFIMFSNVDINISLHNIFLMWILLFLLYHGKMEM